MQVAVPRPLFPAFTYEVPESLLRPGETTLPPGSRVRVPFGRPGRGPGGRGTGELVGVVLGPAGEGGENRETGPPPPAPGAAKRPRTLKPVSERFDDPVPAVPEDLLALARRLADETVTPLGLMLRVLLPPEGGRGRLVRTAALTPAGSARLGEPDDAPPKLAEDDRRILTLLAMSSGPVPFARIRGELELSSTRRFGRLEREGLLEVAVARKLAPLLPGAAEPAPARLAPPLNPAQAAAAERLEAALPARRFAAFLLHGITGSGKTEVYFRAAAACREAGRGVILLAPEIALAARLGRLFGERFGSGAAVFHSGLTAAERRAAFWRVRTGEARIVLGARSAALAPVRDLGLIVLDEEHDGAYQQEETPRYHAGQAAWLRARSSGAVLLLGSATPSLTAAHAAAAGAVTRLALPERAAGARLPVVELADMRPVLREAAAGADGGPPLFAPVLADALRETVEAEDRQALVLVNRRGYGGRLVCLRCGEILECRQCRVALTLHLRGHLAVCHSCGVGFPTPAECLACGGEVLRSEGFGAQRVEEEAARLLPGIPIGRFDRDSTRSRGSHEGILEAFRRGEIRVLVGTQMIAKGHDFPSVTLVGVVAADAGLGIPDYRAAERTFQLLTQVAGRAGRGAVPGRVVIQTLNPDHYAVATASRQDYAAFAAAEREMRRRFRYPPFLRLTRLTVSDRVSARAESAARSLAAAFGEGGVEGGVEGGEVEVVGPAPAARSGSRDLHRWQLLLKSAPPAQPAIRARLRRFLSIPELSRRLTVETNP